MTRDMGASISLEHWVGRSATGSSVMRRTAVGNAVLALEHLNGWHTPLVKGRDPGELWMHRDRRMSARPLRQPGGLWFKLPVSRSVTAGFVVASAAQVIRSQPVASKLD